MAIRRWLQLEQDIQQLLDLGREMMDIPSDGIYVRVEKGKLIDFNPAWCVEDDEVTKLYNGWIQQDGSITWFDKS
jgi:hypothetical protein